MGPENYLVLRDTQNWAARSHRELYDSVHHFNDPGQAGEIGSEWARFGTELTESAELIAKRVAASESGWTGAAAEGARVAIRGLAEWITLTARTAVEVGEKVAAQGRIMATARATMPEPSSFSLDDAARAQGDPGLAGFTASAADMQAAGEKARAAHEQAVAVMETMERQSHDIDASTPAFTLPYNPTTGKAQEPPQPAVPRSSDGPSLGGASGPPPASPPSTPDPSAPPPSPGGAPPLAPAAFSSPPGGDAPAVQPQGEPAYQPAAHQPSHDGTAVAAASAPGYQPAASGYHAPGVSGSAAPAEHRPQQYGTPVPLTPQPNVPRTGATDPRTSPRTAGTAATGGQGTAARPAGGGGGFGGGGAARGAFPAGQFAPGGSAGAQMQPGGAAGVTSPGRGPVPAGGVGPGAAAAAGSAAGGGPAGGPASGKGEEDKEHRSASYLMGGDLFEVPGENLPPAVIGGAKPRKTGPPEQTT
ncbi:hypothetical protein UK23_43265 [Lentzea aerocolonigenes]|uniref:PPE family domain-containing protein n=1 Tax=Lentzea aerocolonigenes TaxID=68170 RepID=A0A0F0GCH3_LENAE|nr:hypothetical protein [Lentzea aerocolonigenes]KJK34775.1 hypothetical protein UK23_43265 [Lentzea aerocolonigenes]